MNDAPGIMHWIRTHRWRILLVSLLGLLVISPLSDIYNRADNLISPLAALVLMGVALTTGLQVVALAAMTLFIVGWLVISILTDGSGLFAGASIVAPVVFLALMGWVFVLLARWLARITVVNAEALCAAVCGYLIVGIFWTGIYALVQAVDTRAIVSSDRPTLEHGDLLYFSYTTLTTTGFGDLIPKNPTARMWTVLEAVVGTFYNAIVIARFVTLYGYRTTQNPASP